MPAKLTSTQKLISKTCDEVKELLLTKNREYGNSAMEPINVFSGIDSEEQIKVRIDDKLSRIKQVRQLDKLAIHEDTEKDLIGYLVLLQVSRELNSKL